MGVGNDDFCIVVLFIAGKKETLKNLFFSLRLEIELTALLKINCLVLIHFA